MEISDKQWKKSLPVRTPNCKTAVSAALAISCTKVWEDVCVSPVPSSLTAPALACSTSSSSKSRPNISYCCRNLGFDKTVCARFNVRKVSTSPPGLSGWCCEVRYQRNYPMSALRNGRRKKNLVSMHFDCGRQERPWEFQSYTHRSILTRIESLRKFFLTTLRNSSSSPAWLSAPGRGFGIFKYV